MFLNRYFFLSLKKMEERKEMFAQMMKFQMKSQQKNEEKLLQLQRENEERILKNEEKQQRFFLELKKQEALFKNLSNNQPIDSTTIFSQNAVWNALKTFSYAPDEDKTFEAYFRRYKDIYITDCAEWTEATKKSPATSTKARNCGTEQVHRLCLTKKTCQLGFSETVKLLSELFSSKTSLPHNRWKCLNLKKRDSDDYLGFASIVN